MNDRKMPFGEAFGKLQSRFFEGTGWVQEKLKTLGGKKADISQKKEGVEDLEASIREGTQRRIVVALAVLLAISVLVLLVRAVRSNREYGNFSVSWEKTMGEGEASYYPYASQVLKVTGEGISSVNTNGELLWSYGSSMINPKVYIRGNFGAVVDLQSETAVIFNREGVTGEVSATLPILDFTVSSHGVLALELDEGNVNYIYFYDNTGKVLDIRIKTMLSGDGFPLDLSLSPTGTGLLASMVYLDQGSMQNRLVFYNFDVGKSEHDRIVGEFAYGSTMFPEAQYLNDKAAVAFGDDQVNFYSLRNESRPTLVRSIPYEKDIYSVFTGTDRAGVISEAENGRILTVYDAAGKEIYHTDITFDYTSAEFSGKYTLLYNGSDCRVFTEKGKLRFHGGLGGAVRKVIMTGDDSCLLFAGSDMKKLRFR